MALNNLNAWCFLILPSCPFIATGDRGRNLPPGKTRLACLKYLETCYGYAERPGARLYEIKIFSHSHGDLKNQVKTLDLPIKSGNDEGGNRIKMLG